MTHDQNAGQRALGFPEMTWAAVDRPGCYVVTQTGRLVRITQDALQSHGNRPEIVARTWVARISNNPEEAVVVLRDLASAGGYFVNF